jgi:hypothetical protein
MAAATVTDTLIKPDMKAVLARTHVAFNLHGFLLPVFEAISNAMDGIESRFNSEASEKGRVHVHFVNANDPMRIAVTVTDNGVGLTDENYRSFRTPFSGHKLKAKGRGFGRFIAFKVFGRSRYYSRYNFLGDVRNRTFRFDINEEKEFIFLEPRPADDDGLCVEFDQLMTDWHDLVRTMTLNEVSDEIGGHFLPFFLYRWLPMITIQFDDNPPEDVTSHFKGAYVQYDGGEFKCEIEDREETLTYALSRTKRSNAFKNHCLMLSAADRIVGSPRDLTNKLGQPHFIDENNERYVVLAVVRGDALENRLNDARTSINLSAKVVEDIVSQVSNIIETKEAGQVEKIKTDQSLGLDQALRENPILRLGLRGKTLNEYVRARPNIGAQSSLSPILRSSATGRART